MPKNVFISDIKTRENSEDESLRDIYQELDLKNLTVIYIDTTVNPLFRENQSNMYPFGGREMQLEGLNKEMSFLELLEKIVEQSKWDVDKIRLWDQSAYEDFLEKNYNVFDVSEYRDRIPNFTSLVEDEIVFPLFLTDQVLVVEKVDLPRQNFPNSPAPLVLDETEWLQTVVEDWGGRTPLKNKAVYDNVEIILSERNERQNSLFNTLGFLLQIISQVKGEAEADESKEGITQQSLYRAAKVRKELARFTTDNFERVEESKILSSQDIDTVEQYVKKVLDPSYKGGDLELTLASIMNGCIIEVYWAVDKKVRVYGRGYVERYINPDRLSPKFSIKLVRWFDGNYDPITFSMQPGLDPDRQEYPFNTAYSLKCFEWIMTIPEDSKRAPVFCSNCNKSEEKGEHLRCANCRLVFYCSKRCQILHWRSIHRGVCQKRNFAEESKSSRKEEDAAYCQLYDELQQRKRNEIGIRKVRLKASEENALDVTHEMNKNVQSVKIEGL